MLGSKKTADASGQRTVLGRVYGAQWRDWRGAEGVRGLPSAPEPPVLVHEATDRPQVPATLRDGSL